MWSYLESRAKKIAYHQSEIDFWAEKISDPYLHSCFLTFAETEIALSDDPNLEKIYLSVMGNKS